MRKLLTSIMCLLLLITSLPYQNKVKAEEEIIYLSEDETLSDSLNELSGESHFYFATSGAYLPENGSQYAIRLSRTGDADASASVVVNIADFNGRYGEDYSVSLLGGEKAIAEEGMFSFTELMQGPYETGTIAKNNQLEEDIASDEEVRQEFADAVNDTIKLIEEVSGAETPDEEEQYTLNDIEKTIEEAAEKSDNQEEENTPLSEEASESADEETIEKEEPVEVQEDDIKTEHILIEADKEDDPEIIFTNSLQQEFYESTGITTERQEVTTSENNTSDQIQQIADFINSMTIGAKLEVEFSPGETDKYIIITPINNNTADGDRYFYLTLTEPEGASATGQNTCAVTILDNEEVPANEVSFYIGDETKDSITVIVSRSGCLNQISHVKLQTTGNGTAMISRDYSPVDIDVVLPFNIPETQVTIPVRREFLNSDSTFELQLTAVQNATVKEDTLEVMIRKNLNPSIMLLSDDDDSATSVGVSVPRGLNTVLVDENSYNNIKTKKDFVLKYHSNNYDGVNRFEGEGYRMYWERDSFFSSDWTGKVLMATDVGGSSLYYSGARVNVSKGGTCFKYSVGFGSEAQARQSGSSIGSGMARVYESKNSLSRQDVDYFSPLPPEKDSLYIKFENFGGCSDCNSLWIYDMSPIYRWYQITAESGGAESFTGADGEIHSSDNSPLFLNIDGNYVPNYNAGKMSFVGAVNETPNQICTYVDDTLTLVHNQDVTVYDPFVYLKEVKTSTGKRVASFDGGPSNAYSFLFSSGLMYNSLSYQGFDSNNQPIDGDYDIYFKKNASITADGVYYGYGTFKTVMGYKPVSVVVKDQKDFGEKLGSLVLSSKEVAAGTYDNVYHKGDILYATYNIDSRYASDFEFAGVEVRAKINKTDMDYLDAVFISANKEGGVYIDQNQDNRLHYEYYEITPVLSYKNNGIKLRVKLSDLNKFDTTYGIFADSERAFIVIDENGVIYRQYILRGVSTRKIYSIPVKMKNENYTPVWELADSTASYGGDVFYYETGKSLEENVIYLSATSDIQKFTLDGQISRYSYNSQTSSVERNLFPFEGAMVVMGSSSALTDENGEFTLSGTSGKNSIARYLISYNGKTEIREVNVKTDYAADNFILNPENGTILSHLDVFVDNKGATGSVITLNNGIATIIISDDGRAVYKKTVETSEGFEEVDAVEKLQKVVAVVRDENGAERFTQVATYQEESDGKPAGYRVDLAHSQIAPGDKLYLKVSSDRTPAGLLPYDENGNPIPEEELKKLSVTNYHEIYSGYSFASSGIIEIPAKQKFDFMPNISFDELPIIGGIGFYMAFPYVHVNIEVRDGEYLMSIGVSVMDIVDKAKKTHINQYANGEIYSSMFSQGADGLIDGWKQGLKNSSELIGNMRKAAKEGINTASALGGTTWRFDVAVGAYMKFTLLDIQRPDMSYKKDFFLTGVGGYVGVTGGFRWTVYGIIPVVFIPWYFGVQVEAMLNAFFGESVDPNKVTSPVVSFNQAGEETVDMGSMEFFDSSVKALVTGQIFVGAGICGVLGARGGGTVKIMALWEPNGRDDHDDFGGLVVFSAGFWFDLFVFTLPLQYSFPDIRFGLVKQLGKQSVSSQTGSDTMTLSGGEDQGFVFRNYNNSDEGKWIGGVIDNASLKPVTESILEHNPYEHPDSKLLNLSDGRIALLYLDKNTEKVGNGNSALYASELKIAILDPEKGWSKPVAVQGDGTSDFDASMTEMKKDEDGNIRILAAWASTPYEKTDSIQTVKQYLTELEIYAAEIVIKNTDDTEPRIEISKIRLTENSNSDSQPVVLYDETSNTYAVFYVTANPANGKDTISLANPYVNGSMVKYITVNGNLSPDDENYIKGGFLNRELNVGNDTIVPAVVDMVGVDLNDRSVLSNITSSGLAVLAYTVDMDSSNDTTNDKEIYIQLYDFANDRISNPIAITDDECFGGLSDALPKFVKSSHKTGDTVNEEVKLFWYRNDRAIAYTSISDLLRFGISNQNGKYVINDDYRKGNSNALSADDSLSNAFEYDDIVHDSLERICSYVSPEGTSEADLKMMSNFIVGSTGIEGEDIYVVWTQVPPSENGVSDSVELYITAIQSDDHRHENAGDSVLNDPHIDESYSEEDMSFWSKPYRLTNNTADPDDPTVMRVIDEPSVVISSNGRATVVFNEYHQKLMLEEEYANEPVQITEMKLKYIGMAPSGSVDVRDIEISDMSPSAGEEIEITVTLENSGITIANGYEVTVTVKDKDGQDKGVLISKTSNTSIRPGGSVSEKMTWKAESDVEGIYFLATAKETSYFETSELESEKLNSVADLSLDNISLVEDENGIGIVVTVTNNGNREAGNNDFFTMTLTGPYSITSALKTGDLKVDDLTIVKESLAGVKPGETITKTIYPGINKNILEKYGYIETYACAEKLTDITDENGNTTILSSEYGTGRSVTIRPSIPTEFTLNGNKMPSSIEMKLGDSLNLNVETSPVKSESTGFISSDTDVVVIKDGKLVAVGTGTAQITGYTLPQGTVFGPINITVNPAKKPDDNGNGGGSSGKSESSATEAIETPVSPVVNRNPSSLNKEGELTETEIAVKDQEGNIIEGLVLRVIDKDGDVIDLWTTSSEAHVIKGLKTGETYTLEVAKAPESMVFNHREISFTVTGEKLNIELIGGHTRVFIHLNEGTAATLSDRYGICIANWIADKEAYYTEDLGSGEYTVNSSKIVVEATTDEQHFYIKEDGTVVTEKRNFWWIYMLAAAGVIIIILIVKKKKDEDDK